MPYLPEGSETMKDVCIFGGGAALATRVIKGFLGRGDQVYAVCRKHAPGEVDPHDRLKVLWVDADDLDDYLPALRKFDTVVTLPGSFENAKLDDMTYQQWDKVIDDTLTSVAKFLMTLSGKIMEGANVVVVGSVVGSTGCYGASGYAAAKAGLVGLVRSLALEWAGVGVKVNLLELGYIDAGMGARLSEKAKARAVELIPLGRFGSEEDVWHAVEFLSETDYMTGGVLTLAGGLR